MQPTHFNDDFITFNASSSLHDATLAFLEGANFYTYQESQDRLRSKFKGYSRDNEFVQSLDWTSSLVHLSASSTSLTSQRFFLAIDHYDDPTSAPLDDYHPLTLTTKASDEDSPKWFEAMKGENSEGFWKAMGIEMNTLADMNAYCVVPQTKEIHVISSTWAFKIKRFPSGLVQKLKAHFCCCGDQ